MAGRRKSRSKRRWTLPEIDWVSAGRALVGSAWLAGLGGVVGAWIICVPRLEAYASSRRPAGELEVRFVNPPEWVGDDLVAALLATARGQIDPDPLQRRGLVAAREALLATGWFEQVLQVRRVDRGDVEINARFARPFAVIREPGGALDHVVDSLGKRLPRSYRAGEAEGFAVIVGVALDRPARPGDRWSGADVAAGLQVLRMLAGKPWSGQVAEVDVAGFANHSTIRLRSDRGCTIVWGRPPGDEQASEVPALRKLSYLDYHYEHYGHIDRGFPRELDITGDVVIGR